MRRLVYYALALLLVVILRHLDLTWYTSFPGFLLYWGCVAIVLTALGLILYRRKNGGSQVS